MIFRRLALAIKRQDWATVLVEFVLVIAGVLIALQLNNWNERQAQRREETRYLEQLLVEFVVIRDALENQKNSYAEFRDAALEFVVLAEGDGDVGPERLSYLYETAFAGRIPSGAPAALRELISAGKMGLISNREIRTLLMRVDFDAELASRVFDLLRTALLEQLQDLRVHVNYDTGNPNPDGASGSQTTFAVRSYAVDLQSLREDRRAIATAKAYLESQQNMLDVIAGYLERVQEVIDALDAELNRERHRSATS